MRRHQLLGDDRRPERAPLLYGMAIPDSQDSHAAVASLHATRESHDETDFG